MRSISFKVVTSTFVLIVAFVAFVVVYFPHVQRQQQLAAFEREIEVTTETLALAIAVGLDSFDYESMQLAFNYAKREAAITQIVVAAPDGEVIGAFPEDARWDPAWASATLRYDDGRLIHSAPISAGESDYGSVVLVESLAALDAGIDRSRRNTLGVGLLLLLTGLAAIYAIAAYIAAPIRQLTETTRALAGGDFSARAVVRGRDETGLLAHHFNEMAETIDRGRRELEDRVARRTRELSQATEELEARAEELTGTVHDLEIARDEAQAATRAKSEFLANMSHEIRTPMNGVIGMTSLLVDTGLDADQREFVETIRTSGEALMTVINDILDFSKIEAGQLDIEAYPFDVRQCVEDALDLIAPRAADKGVELAYIVEDGVPGAAVGDVTRVRQVLVNLLSNAVKFTAVGGVCVRVSAAPPDVAPGGRTALWFAVEDTGIGIARGKLESVFDSFSQADASTTRRFGGTGLGLTISRGLVDMMGGEMRVESVEGEGSTFRFSVAVEVAPSERRVHLHRDQPALAGRTVLVVDDHAVNREILCRLSAQWGMAVQAVASGRDALAELGRLRAAGRTVDLVLLDMQMPEMDGLEVAERIRDAGSPPVVVMLTSISRDATLKARAAAAGVYAVLYKPTKPSQLHDIVVRAFAAAPEPPSPLADGAWVARPFAEEPPRSAHRVLLAEDNAVNQKVAVRLLSRLGIRADVVADGAEAVEAVRRQATHGQPYDVILMDIQMPRMDGLEATRRIRTLDLDQPHIIALTANAMEGDRERCLEAGCDNYLTKPIVVEALHRAFGEVPESPAKLAEAD
ncbi:response regulator [Rubrivirga sp. IMCC45206]|uniref:response regulator n=1 Tax=Rubrivirga sp. IMCC45206 TaxID=3391614 RepID=UPI00398FE127